MTSADPTASPDPAPEVPARPQLATGGGEDAPRVTGLLLDEEGWVVARPPRTIEVLGRVLAFPLLFVRHRDLIATSCKRDLEARFQGTLLGWFWPLFHPLFLFLVYYFIFAELLNFKMPNLQESQKAAMGVFMFIGILIWSSIAETLIRGTNAIVDNGDLIKKLAFPSEVLPLNVTLVGLATMLFGVVVFVLACWVTPIWAAPGLPLLWIPLLVLLQGLFAYGLALFLSTLQVFLRDTLQVVSVLTTIWMFATPIFWAPEALAGAERFRGLLEANPVYHLVQAWRGVLMGDLFVPASPGVSGGFVSSVEAIPARVGTFGVWSLAVFVLGFAFFVLCQRRFADEV